MRIVHLLSYVSAEGAYGGPVAVAAQQCAGLADRGHDVTLIAGWDGVGHLESSGVEVLYRRARRVPGLGFGGLFSPDLITTALRLARGADVIHAHLSRDFAVLPAAHIASSVCPLVVQAHGMIRPANSVSKRAVDSLMTKKVLTRAKSVLCLTSQEAEELPRVAESALPTTRIRNAVSPSCRRLPGIRGEQPEVLFLARLHERKRPLDFVKMAEILIKEGTNAHFAMAGPDEGQRQIVQREIRARGLSRRITLEGPVPPERVLERMAQASLYVLPSVEEPFPMSVLEALSLGVPVVITTETGISAEIAASSAGIAVGPTPSELARAVGRILDDPQRWQHWSNGAHAAANTLFAPSRMLDALEAAYHRSIKPYR